MSREKLQIMINEMCSKLNHPLTIINLNYDDSDNISLKARLDSTASIYTFRQSCWNLRTYIGENNCINCDYYHAKLCSKLVSGADIDLKKLDFFPKAYTQPILKKFNDTNYIQYNCPMLGFVELCFPIRFRDHIIGVLFLGELLLEGEQPVIKNYQDCFLNENKYLFEEYAQMYKQKYSTYPPIEKMIGIDETSNGNKLAENLLKRRFKVPKVNLMNPLSKEDFNKLLLDATTQIKKFEKEIENIWLERQEKQLLITIEELRTDFDALYRNICDKNEIIYTDVQELFEEVCQYIVKIKKHFNFTYCRVFENLPIVQTRLIMQRTNDIGDCPYNDLNCDFKKCELRISKCKNSNTDNDDGNPLKCFTNGGKDIDSNKNLVFACKNIAVIFGISEKQENYDILVETIGNAIQHICGDIEYIASTFTRTHYESTLRMYKHECDHLAVRIERNNMYYENRKSYEALSDEKHKKIFNDIKSTAILLQHLSLNIGVIQGTIDINNKKEPKCYVDIRDEFNKWRAMFRLELAKKNIRLLNTTKISNEGTKVLAYESLLVLLLYNIIDNAIKYSYWGTNIRTEIDQGKITIEDYGLPISNSNQVYDLFYRAPGVKNNHLGDGIGLYSSKNIANLLGVDLSHICEQISPYNVPFVLEAHKRGWNLAEYGINYNDVIDSIDKKTLSEMIIDSEYYGDNMFNRITEEQLKCELKNPTFRVKFTINNFSYAKFIQ